jgi:hypothetical protein
MTHASTFSLRATTAICAVLALGSTAAWAQEVAPPPDAPATTASPAAPQTPTLQLPDQPPAPPIPTATSAPASPPTMVSQPLVQQTAQTAAPSEAVRDAEAAAPAASVAPAAVAPRPAARPAGAARSSAAAQPAVGANSPTSSRVSPTPPAASVPLAQPAVPPAATRPAAAAPTQADPTQADPTQAGSSMNPAIWVAAIILVLGGAAAAFFATRPRRRPEDEVYDEAYQTVPQQAYAEPEATRVANAPTGGLEPEAPLPAFATVEDVAGTPAVVHDDPNEREVAREMIGTEELAPATPAVAAEGEPFTIPAGPVPRGEARDELLRRMVAAPPDAENPFRSRKARLRRARLILQSLEQKQKDAASEPFDWRTYKPSTSHPAPATPPRVTA